MDRETERRTDGQEKILIDRLTTVKQTERGRHKVIWPDKQID